MVWLGWLPDRAFLAFGLALLVGVFGTVGTAQARGPFRYEVTVTNLAHGEFAQAGDFCRTGQLLGFFAFATHRPDFRLFELGRPVSGELALLAESGLPFLLADSLAANPEVGHPFSVPAVEDFPAKFLDGVVCAGEELTTTIQASPGDLFSMAAMIFPTNDGFIALNGVHLPVNDRPVTYFSPVYDAGSESNDELCIPHAGRTRVTGLPRPCRPDDTGPEHNRRSRTRRGICAHSFGYPWGRRSAPE